jgi:hypothetical protein
MGGSLGVEWYGRVPEDGVSGPFRHDALCSSRIGRTCFLYDVYGKAISNGEEKRLTMSAQVDDLRRGWKHVTQTGTWQDFNSFKTWVPNLGMGIHFRKSGAAKRWRLQETI